LYHAAPRGADAVWLAAGAIATIWLVQIALGSIGVLDWVFVGASFLAAGAMVVAVARRQHFSLGVRRPAPRFIAAGILIGVASWYLRLQLVEWLAVPDDTRHLEALVTRPGIVPSLVAVALLPAICEELVFRGVIARALARRSQVLAIVGSAAIFAAYHVLPIQMIAVFPFGLVLAFVALRADSIVPTMIAHFINNVAVIAISRGDLNELMRATTDHPQLAVVVTTGLVVIGLALAAKGVVS
jgi:membrane protease YdiL (CAAX protease family)